MRRENFIVTVCLLLGACSSSSSSGGPTTPPPPPDYVKTSDIPYTSEMLLDVYAPAEEGSYPTVVAIHGGGGSKTDLHTLSRRLAEEGIVVFAIGWHSLSPNSREVYLTGWEDGACAVRFVRQHAAEYDGDPSRIIVVAFSAGAAMGATITLAGDDFAGDCLVEEGSALPDGFVGMDGPYRILEHVSPDVLAEVPEDTVDLIEPFDALQRSPVRQDVEFIVFEGDQEPYCDDSGEFYPALLSRGYSAELIQYTNYLHLDFVANIRTQTIEAIANLAKNQ